MEKIKDDNYNNLLNASYNDENRHKNRHNNCGAKFQNTNTGNKKVQVGNG